MASKVENLKMWVSETYSISIDDFYLLCNGKKLESIQDPCTYPIHIVPRLCGGKGGFGSMLRAIGAQIEKTTNREACRDLSGRRLRDINEERRMKNWLSQKEENDKESKKRRKNKLERMCQEPKTEFDDKNYEEQRASLTENISESLERGLKAGPSGLSGKRSNDTSDSPTKKKKLKGMLLEIDIDDMSSDLSDSDGSTNSVSNVKYTSDSVEKYNNSSTITIETSDSGKSDDQKDTSDTNESLDLDNRNICNDGVIVKIS